MNAPCIAIRDLGRRFGKQQALSAIDLHVQVGELLAVVGPDGSGKTSLLQMLAGILTPTSGQGEVLGVDLLTKAAKIAARVGYMSQGFTLYDRLSVAENLAFSARIRNVSDRQYTERAPALLAMAGLQRFVTRRAGALSGGMRKKLSLCCNLVHEPELLILDEPGLGVDPLSRRELWRMLERFRERGTTIVFATSYLDEAETGDRVLMLSSGRAVALDSPCQLKTRCANRVFEWQHAATNPFFTPFSASLWRSHKRLVDRHRVLLSSPIEVPPENVWAAAPTLEDVFVDLTSSETTMAAVGPELPSALAMSNRLLPDSSSAHAKSTAAHAESSAAQTRQGIEIDSLTVRFGQFAALDAVSIRIERGEIVAFLGPNGAGKTTLIRSLCGLQPPTAGRAVVAGFDAWSQRMTVRAQIGYMSQQVSLYPDLSARENLAFYASAYGLPGRAARVAIGWACEVTALTLDERFVRALSAATRQRLALACCLLHRPSILFLDEPTAGVDPQARYRFWSVIQQLASAGMTVLISTHYLIEAEHCHRLGLMHNGRLFAQGTLPALRAQYGLASDSSVEAIFIAGIADENAAQAAA